MPQEYKTLTKEQIDHFMQHGYIKIERAFTPEKAKEWTKDVWIRLGYDMNDKTTWARDRIHMPMHKSEPVKDFAPQAWAAICELLGGEEKIDPKNAFWHDSFIVNLGAAKWEGDDVVIEPQNLDNWHIDGDFFVHFLDSPEQALLVIPIFSEIGHRGGGTFICPDGLIRNARYLSEHPEGVLPTGLSFTPTTAAHIPDTPESPNPHRWSHLEEVKKCSQFVEVTGSPGDVYLLHPLMLHSASKNHTRIPRIITNPPVSLIQPFCFDKENDEDYSLVEKKTLSALGVDRFPFKATTERKGIVPERVRVQMKMLEEEKKRLAELEKKMQDTNISQIVAAAA